MSTGFNNNQRGNSVSDEMQNLREPFLTNNSMVQGNIAKVPSQVLNAEKSDVFIDQDNIKQGRHKRKLDQYFQDISNKCSMESFYQVEQVFSRAHSCPVVAILLKILDPELQQLYAQHQVADKLLFDKESRDPTHILQVWHYDKNFDVSKKVYQQLLDSSVTLQDCSISDTFVAYTVSTQTLHQQSQVIVIDLKHQQEVRFSNPLRMELTGIYVDEDTLLLGGSVHICELKPAKLFLETSNLDEHIKQNQELHKLPDKDCVVYAFWRPKKSPIIEVYSKSTVGLQIRVYTIKHKTKNENLMKRKSYITPSAAQARKQSLSSEESQSLYISAGASSGSGNSQKAELTLKTVINLSDQNANKVSSRRFETHSKSDFTHAIVEEESDSAEEDPVDRPNFENEDNEKEDLNDEDLDQVEGTPINTVQPLQSLNIQADGDDAFDDYAQGQQINKTPRPESLAMTKAKSSYSQSRTPELQQELLKPKKVASHRRRKDENSSGSSFAGLLEEQIVRVKFHYRTTLVFSSAGDIYFISSSNQVYSTNQIDFKDQKILRDKKAIEEKQKKSNQPRMVDAYIHDEHLYLISEEGTIFSCNTHKFTIVKTVLNVQQVKLMPFQNEIQLFNNYLTYDNIVIVSHSHILSVYDVNANKCGMNPWRHLVPDLEDMNIEDQDITNLIPPNVLSDNVKPEDYHGPFFRVMQDIRLLKLREQKGQAIARIIVFYNNNIIRTLLRDESLRWNFEHYQKKAIPGEIVQIIQSVKQCSLMFFRHKATGSAETCNLVLFYFADQSDVQDYTVLSGIQDHQRIFQISLSNKFKKDLSKTSPRIGIYDDLDRTTTIYELRSTEDAVYGKFIPLFTIQNDQRIQSQDVIIESGNEDFVYLSRQNVIYKYHLTEQLPEQIHQRLETFATIALRNQRAMLTIKAFRVFNNGDFIYASTRTHIYFNFKDRFGKHYSESKLITTLAKTNCLLYSDDIYGRISGFTDPFNIQVFPFLHSNRLSLVGVHHQPQPIFFQSRGKDDFFMLTKNAELMTWSMITGKLKYYSQFTNKQYMGFQKLNTYRGRTVLFKQNEKANYEYLLLEIVKKDEIIQHAKVVSEHKFNMYINSRNDLLVKKVANSQFNQYDIVQFDKISGQLQNTRKTFYNWMPLHFLSPSFDFYISIDYSKCKIHIKRTFSDVIIATIPDNIVTHLYFKKIDFTIETLVNKLIFIEDDLILFELKENFEVLYCVSSDRVLMDFNKMNKFYNFNEHLIAKQYEVDRPKYQKLLTQQTWESEIVNRKLATQTTLQQSQKSQESSPQKKQDSDWWLNQLIDFKFLNQKYLRDKTFIVDYQNAQIVRDREGVLDDVNITQFKMISVQPYSYGLWKMINEVSRQSSTITISNLKPEIQVLMAFSILPKENQTLLHKYIKHDPDQIRELIRCYKTQWPAHPFPHLRNAFNESPLGIAVKNKNRRFVDSLIKYIENLPEDYCQQEVTEYLTTFVQQGYETRVSEYLNARLIKPIWTDKYSRGNLVRSEQNMNQATTANWPSDTIDIEDKFFSKDAENVPLQIQMLNVSNLHAFTNPDSQNLLIELITCDISLLASTSIQYLIEYKWEIAYPSIIFKLFIPFILYLINFQIYLEILFYPQENKTKIMFAWETFGKIFLLMFAVYFLTHHFVQLRRRAYHFFSVAMLWSLCDMIPLFVNLLSITFEFTSMSEETYIRWTRPLYGMATLFLWLKVFYFLRMFRSFGQLVLMIFTVIGQMGTFFAVFFFFIVAFGNTFYSLSMANTYDDRFVTSYLDSWVYTYLITLRNFNTEEFGSIDVVLVWIVFTMATLFFTYIMLNLTVSMVKLYYDRNKRLEKEQTYRVMAQLIIECIDKISPPEIEKELQCKEEKQKYCLLIDEDDDQDQKEKQIKKETFKVYLRPEHIGNQYLLVAKPRHEEDIVIEAENPLMTAVKTLTSQFNQSMSQLRKRIDSEVNSNVQQGIELIDKKIENMHQKHEAEMKEIQETQNLILQQLQLLNKNKSDE